jgi:hypothetical protein
MCLLFINIGFKILNLGVQIFLIRLHLGNLGFKLHGYVGLLMVSAGLLRQKSL